MHTKTLDASESTKSRLSTRGLRSARLMSSASVVTLALTLSVALPRAAQAIDWSGAASSDWLNTGNWAGGVVPPAGTDATVRSNGANAPVVASAGATANSLYLGIDTDVSFTINQTGTLTNHIGFVGFWAGITGTATVDGPNAVWTNTNYFYVGQDGRGLLSVVNGGTVNAVSGFVGFATTSVGSTATIDGAGSTWNMSSNLHVGYFGSGTVNITNGGTVSAPIGILGFDASSRANVVNIDGAGSSLINNVSLTVGNNGSGTINVTNGGSLTSSTSYLALFGGSSGAVNVNGTGSSWGAGTDLLVGVLGQGALNISNGGTVNNGAGFVGFQAGSSGTVTIDSMGSGWTNTGALTVGRNGTGVLTLTNGGIASAATTILAAQAGSSGTLNIGGAVGAAAQAAGGLNSATLQFGAGTGTLNFNHTESVYTFASAMSGAGTINQTAGTTTLTADSSAFTGATNVLGGRLAVDGSLANSAVTVSNGGVLGGIGTVGSVSALSGGAIGPGNSVGTLTVNGNLSQAAGSVYQLELTSTGQTDHVHATGTATITNGATLNVTKLDAAPYVLGTHYTVLQADGGVTGSYLLTGNTMLTAFIGLVESSDPTHIYLDVMQLATFASVGNTPNQKSTGAGLQSLGTGNAVSQAVMALPTGAAARDAFDQLSGEAHASFKGAIVEESKLIRDAATDRLRDAFKTAGAAGTPVMAYASAKPYTAAADTERFAMWGRGFGSWGTSASDGNAASTSHNTGGFVIGGDGFVSDTVRLGALGGYSRSSFQASDRRSSGASDNYHAGIYGGAQWGVMAFRSGAFGTWHDISTSRTVSFAGFDDSLRAAYRARTAQVFGEFGYGIQAGRIGTGLVALEPFANLAYVSLSSGGFTEAGGAAALSEGSSNMATTTTTLGLRASRQSLLSLSSLVTQRGMIGWRHAYGDTTPVSTMSFAGGSPFAIAGTPLSKDNLVVEAGLDVTVSPGAALGVSYSGQFGSGMSEQSVKGTVQVRF